MSSLPEEVVRQRVLSHMIGEKGFPASLIAVETALRCLPHLSAIGRRRVPDRRADIVCFATGKLSLYPLLIVECKAIKLSPDVINQVQGYNQFVRSPFIAVVNQEEMKTGWFDGSGYRFVDYLPAYDELTRSVSMG